MGTFGHKKKKVIFVTGSLSDGGAERVLSILASGCAELGANVTLVILRDKKQSYKVSNKVNCIQVKSKGKFVVFQRIRQLHSILKNSDADAVIPFTPIVTLYAMIANIGIRKRMIMSERANPYLSIFSKDISNKDRIGHFLMRKLGLFNLASWMVFQTPDAQAYYNKKLQSKSSIIPNPIDTSYLPNRFEGSRDKKIVAAGRFNEQKNFEMLIDGFGKFVKNHSDFQLVIYGEGYLLNQYKERAEKLGISSQIEFPGFVNDLPYEIFNATMYISTSNYEGISNAMLEALGMGIPTIVTDCPVGGARMFVKTDQNGILIPMNDVDALVSAMNKIVDNKEYADHISKEAVKVRDYLERDRICEQWLALV